MVEAYLFRGVRGGSQTAGDIPSPPAVKVDTLKPGDTFSANGRPFRILPSDKPNSVIISYPEGSVDWTARSGQYIYPDPNSLNMPHQSFVPHNPGTNVTGYGYNISDDKPGLTVQFKDGDSPSNSGPNPPYLYRSAKLYDQWRIGTAPDGKPGASVAKDINKNFVKPARQGTIPVERYDAPLAVRPVYAKLTPKAAPLAAP